MAPSTGKKLQEARLLRGLSLEDVQHLTRIRRNQLAGMENEDLTVFASRSYARSFYAIYGRFLGVDLTQFLKTMESEGLKRVKHHAYLRPSTNLVTQGHRATVLHAQPLPQAGRLVLVATALALVIVAATWIGNAHWRGSDLDQDPTENSVEPAAHDLPLLAETTSTPPASPPATDQPAPAPVAEASHEPAAQAEVRSTPPPVLKALPIDDPTTTGVQPESERPKVRRGPSEGRRPASFVR